VWYGCVALQDYVHGGVKALLCDGIGEVEGCDCGQGCGFYGEDVGCVAKKNWVIIFSQD